MARTRKWEAANPNWNLKQAKGLPLANRLKKDERSDKTVLADMGLLALLPDAIAPEADRPKPRPMPGKRPRVAAAWLEAVKRGGAKRLERLRAEPHKRPRAHLLRVMEPGKAYVVNDLIRALQGVYGADAIKGQLRFRLPRQGLVERLAVPPGTPHRAPLMHGSPHKDPLTWMYRLTSAGEEERRAVLDRDAVGE